MLPKKSIGFPSLRCVVDKLVPSLDYDLIQQAEIIKVQFDCLLVTARRKEPSAPLAERQILEEAAYRMFVSNLIPESSPSILML